MDSENAFAKNCEQITTRARSPFLKPKRRSICSFLSSSFSLNLDHVKFVYVCPISHGHVGINRSTLKLRGRVLFLPKNEEKNANILDLIGPFYFTVLKFRGLRMNVTAATCHACPLRS